MTKAIVVLYIIISFICGAIYYYFDFWDVLNDDRDVIDAISSILIGSLWPIAVVAYIAYIIIIKKIFMRIVNGIAFVDGFTHGMRERKEMAKKVIRQDVFETNSSSCHTVSVRGREMYANYSLDLPFIEIKLGEYGWDGDPCDDFRSKLAYALSMVMHTEYPNFNQYDEDFVVDQSVLEQLEGYKTLLNAIRIHGRCENIHIKRKNGWYPYGYIDHQSYENYNSLQDFLDDWNVSAERFLFDDGVVVYILNDNG